MHIHNHNHTHARAHSEADAVLISVTAAVPLAALITVGVQTTEGEGCLHKDKHRNKGIMGMQTSSGVNTDTTSSMRAKTINVTD